MIKDFDKDIDFIKVDAYGKIFYGGNQEWWKKDAPLIKKYGCGVIAMCNIELSILCELDTTQAGIANSLIGAAYMEYGYMEISNYMQYVDDRYKKCYGLPLIPPFNAMGLMPWTMARGIKEFYGQFGIKVKSKWAPTLSKNKIIDNISEMVDKGIPIPASYHVFNKKNRLVFYSYNEKNNEVKESSNCTSHYFNITGMKTIKNRYGSELYLIISSWGKKYYIKYLDWVKKLSYFTNILLVLND